ncbi:hypothetical protein LIER_40649 [Lithospermum erythrorhizon]|uniref:Uncharacterized protein n=1 Tax=Lithospermum erythrorhizon TaxID=34254 RepID=A0AAV3R180_LITER
MRKTTKQGNRNTDESCGSGAEKSRRTSSGPVWNSGKGEGRFTDSGRPTMIGGSTPDWLYPSTIPAPRWDFRPQQIELSTFEGENPDGFILKAERYFAIHSYYEL